MSTTELVRMSASIPKDIHEKIKAMAKDQNRSISNMLSVLLAEKLSEDDKKNEETEMP